MVTACSEVRDLNATLIVPDGVKYNFAHRFKVILCGPNKIASTRVRVLIKK